MNGQIGSIVILVLIFSILFQIINNWRTMSLFEENQNFKLLSIKSVSMILMILNGKIFCWESLCASMPDLKPCKCLQNSIICDNIRDDFHLENISKILDSYGNNSVFAKFSLFNTSVEKIEEVFNCVAFKLISITDNKNLSQMSNKAFFGSRETVSVMNVLQNNNLSNSKTNQSLIFDLMTQFQEIEYILLEKNAIYSLSNRVFNSNYNKFVELSYINLRENNITRIESKTFIDLPKLKSINLGQNKINFIDDSAFLLSPNITTALIAIDSNKLNSSSFASNWFSMKLLNSSAKIDIDLSHNNIEYLDQHVFEAILSSKYNIVLNLRYNPFKCDCRSKWLVSNNNLYKSKVRRITCEDQKDLFDKTLTDFANCSSK